MHEKASEKDEQKTSCEMEKGVEKKEVVKASLVLHY